MVFWMSLAFAAPSLTVVDPGSGPRALLAFAPAVGSRESAVLTLDLSAQVTTQGVKLPEPELPAMRLQIEAEVLPPSGAALRYRVVVTGATVAEGGAPDLVAAMAAPLAGLVGLAAVVEMDAQGWPLATRWDASPDADPALLDELGKSLEWTRARLPKVPVGDGARWTLSETSSEGGYSVDQTDTVQLAITDGRWALTSNVLQTAPTPQAVGDTILDKHVASGDARVVLDAAHVLPAEQRLGLTTRTRMTRAETVQTVTQTGLALTVTRTE